MLFSILPTLVEIGLVTAILFARYDWTFVAITFAALALYIVFTVLITEWRTGFRRQMNELDSRANTRAIDSLLNYETVKYFGNEEYEARRYDESLQRWEAAAVKSQTSLSLLNVGAERHHRGRRDADHVARDRRRRRRHDDHRRPGAGQRLHDPALHPAQLPRRRLSRDQAGAGRHGAHVRAAQENARDRGRAGRAARSPSAPREVRFEHVEFAYETQPADPARRELRDTRRRTRWPWSGQSGAGKSTLSRLLFRFYDVTGGRICINGQDIRA